MCFFLFLLLLLLLILLSYAGPNFCRVNFSHLSYLNFCHVNFSYLLCPSSSICSADLQHLHTWRAQSSQGHGQDSRAHGGRRITRRRRATKQAALQAGKAKDAASFINIENPEATIAAYCGCNDIGTFRRFYTSPLVLPYYIKIQAYRGYKRRTYWATDEDPEDVYPVNDGDTRKRNLGYGVGLIAWQMLRGLQKRISSNMLTIDEEGFTKLTNCKFRETYPLSKDEVSSFGPFSGECNIEALNRCLCLFSHIKYTTNKSQWDKRFFETSAWDASVMISAEYLPDWMRAQELADVVESPDEFSGPLGEEPLSVTVVWKHASKNRKNVAYVAELEEQEAFGQMHKSVVIAVTSSMLIPEVRDRIREASKLHEFDGKLAQLTLHTEQEPEADFPALHANWDVIFGMLRKHPNATFSCLFELRPDGQSLWEYGGPPAVLCDYIETKQGDAVSKQKLTSGQAE
ncbi:hypothetical protein K504DRAFT_489843 [Pleomassaria siparia CBS 279.74]|uniref:Uncharacterized protein n=1 Tax=Pleomassaria siparia CBS 279.74 TaxID=1314801 RepID=A0A6G1KD86_9PLEO|nr:hypothetical protein K504DRAFT_489843 [Pleomassaria siparia CBS 279.74]